MIINAANNALKIGQLTIGGRAVGSIDSLGQALTLATPSAGTESAASARKISIHDNFAKEMTKRLAESRAGDGESADPAVLAQSLSGAMGEIEKIFGREAATEVMAKVLNGTADGMDEDSLIQALQNGLADLSRLDPNGAKMKQLTEAFNQDLALALDPDQAEEKIAAGETLSLSYALSRHFGSLYTPEVKGENQTTREDDDSSGEQFPGPITRGLTVPEGVDGGIDLVEANAALAEARTQTPERVERQRGQVETHEMLGFGADGRWGLVEVAEPEEVAEAELKEAAEASLAQAQELDLAQIIDNENGAKVFEELSKFLKNTLQDEEAAAFVDKSLKEAQAVLDNKYGTAPNLTETLSQVYAKVADEGDADKLTALTNYVNNDFKDNLNPILAEMQTGLVSQLAGGEIGELMFKGLIGPGAAGETDTFSLKWGYKDDEAFDKTYSRRYLDEDIQAVRSALEDQEAAARRNMEMAQAQMADEAELRKAGFVNAVAQPEEVAKANKDLPGGPTGYHVPGFSHIDPDPGVNNKIWDDVGSGEETAPDKAEAERKKLLTAMTLKFGQLDDQTLAELGEYLGQAFGQEEADRLMSQVNRTGELMEGLAAIHRDIRDNGGEAQAAGFVGFLNSEMKDEVGRAANDLGLEFDGWQSLDGISGELTATFSIQGTERTATVTILGPEARATDDASAEAILRANEAAQQEREAREIPKHLQKPRATGYLIDLMA